MIKDILVMGSQPETWEQALEQTYTALRDHGYVKDSFLSACIERERDFPTGLPTEIGVAIPHTGSEHVIVPSICVLRLEKPVFFRDMGNFDNLVEVHYVFNMALNDSNDQLPMLQAIIRLVKDSKYLLSCKTKSINQIKNELIEFWCNGNHREPPLT